jgi:hypothetical protein
LEKTTGRKIQPIRKLSFDPGRLDKFWIKNVVAIGLSSSFLEPLQATSIHTTLLQVDTLFSNFFSLNKKEFFLEQNLKRYNEVMGTLVDEYKDLIRIHYYNKRNDSEFWKFCNNELPMSDFVKNIIEICKYRSPSTFDFSSYNGSSGWGVWCWTLYGLETLSKPAVFNTLKKYSLIHYTKQLHTKIIRRADEGAKLLQTQEQFIKNLMSGKFYS